jgi:hypothetical protein
MKREDIGALLRSLPDSGRHRLENSLARSAQGFPSDLRSQLYTDQDRGDVANSLSKILGQFEYSSLTNLEASEKGKLGSYSIMSPWNERGDDLLPYYHQTHTANLVDLRSAWDRVKLLIPERSLTPDTLRLAFEFMTKGTSSGLPFMTRDKSVLGSYLDRATEITDPGEIYPCVIGWRGQPVGPGKLPKQRIVWMFDHAETILGLSILNPMLSRLRMHPEFVSWNDLDTIDVAITHLLSLEGTKFSSDFTAFDSSVSRLLIDFVFELFEYWFIPEARERIHLLREVFATVSMVTPDGIWTERNGGVPSGSALTNMVDSLVNLLAYHYCAIRMNVRNVAVTVLGDDSVYIFDPSPTANDLEVAARELGLVMSETKQMVSDSEIHYLQRLHSRSWVVSGVNVGVRSAFRFLNGALSYERRRPQGEWNRWMAAARTIMQLENCKNHPKFTRIVKFAGEGDTLLFEMDPVEIFSRAGGSEFIRDVLRIGSFRYTSRDPEGIGSFAVTAVLRNL